MFKEPITNFINEDVKEKVEGIDEKIEEELKKPNVDKHKILKMEEEKLLQGLFLNELASPFTKYRAPW
jgi:hypothetical protein